MEQLLDRTTYRQIKQMYKDTMQRFIQDVYESGKQKPSPVLLTMMRFVLILHRSTASVKSG